MSEELIEIAPENNHEQEVAAPSLLEPARYKCNVCERNFKNPHALVVHTARKHNKTKPNQETRRTELPKGDKGVLVREYLHKHPDKGFKELRQLIRQETGVSVSDSVFYVQRKKLAQVTPQTKKQPKPIRPEQPRKESFSFSYCPCCGTNLKVIEAALQVAQSVMPGNEE